jgi:hypothetical protein
VRLCMEYANKNFPDWLNPEAYWDWIQKRKVEPKNSTFSYI